MKNGGEARFKRTQMDIMMNTIVLAIFAILAVFCCIAMGLHIMFETKIGANFQEYLPWERINPDKEWSPTKAGFQIDAFLFFKLRSFSDWLMFRERIFDWPVSI